MHTPDVDEESELEVGREEPLKYSLYGMAYKVAQAGDYDVLDTGGNGDAHDIDLDRQTWLPKV